MYILDPRHLHIVKIDGAYQVIANILFNDDAEEWNSGLKLSSIMISILQLKITKGYVSSDIIIINAERIQSKISTTDRRSFEITGGTLVTLYQTLRS